MAAEDLVEAFCEQVDGATESWRLERVNGIRIGDTYRIEGFSVEFFGGQAMSEGLATPEATIAVRGIRYRFDDQHVSIATPNLVLGSVRDTLTRGVIFQPAYTRGITSFERVERILATDGELEMALQIVTHPQRSFKERQALAKLTEQEQLVYEAWREKSGAEQSKLYAGQRAAMRQGVTHRWPTSFSRRLGGGEPYTP